MVATLPSQIRVASEEIPGLHLTAAGPLERVQHQPPIEGRQRQARFGMSDDSTGDIA
jgi:hypothetical protein